MYVPSSLNIYVFLESSKRRMCLYILHFWNKEFEVLRLLCPLHIELLGVKEYANLQMIKRLKQIDIGLFFPADHKRDKNQKIDDRIIIWKNIKLIQFTISGDKGFERLLMDWRKEGIDTAIFYNFELTDKSYVKRVTNSIIWLNVLIMGRSLQLNLELQEYKKLHPYVPTIWRGVKVINNYTLTKGEVHLWENAMSAEKGNIKMEFKAWCDLITIIETRANIHQIRKVYEMLITRLLSLVI